MTVRTLYMPVPEWTEIVSKMPEKKLICKIGKNGFLLVPCEFWDDMIRESVKVFDGVFKGKIYVFLNPEQKLTMVSYEGLNHLLGKGI